MGWIYAGLNELLSAMIRVTRQNDEYLAFPDSFRGDGAGVNLKTRPNI